MATRLILTADHIRIVPEAATNGYDLYRLTLDEIGKHSSRGARIRVFRHAMIHAGFPVRCEIETVKGEQVLSWSPYERCPICEASLA